MTDAVQIALIAAVGSVLSATVGTLAAIWMNRVRRRDRRMAHLPRDVHRNGERRKH